MSVRSLGPSIGYHGCDQETADAVLLRGESLRKSTNEYDWLGNGVYCWLDSPERALLWAKQTKKQKPAVIGVIINPGNCLNLADVSSTKSIKDTYQTLKDAYSKLDKALPENKSPDSQGLFLRRTLDCKVIELLHSFAERSGEASYDSVVGVFEEGAPIFPGSAMKERTHVQIAVRNFSCILGYFRVPFRLIT